jgi:HemY protein
VRFIFAGFIALLVAVLVTLWVKQDNGYVLIGYGLWTVEGSLALFTLLGLAFFLFLHLSLRILSRLWHMPDRVTEWRRKRRKLRAHRSLTLGLVEMAEGRWKVAERHLTRHAELSETPLINYLAAARAAQLQGAHGRRDDYLHLAHESMPSADVAVGLTQAELQLAHQQYEQALASLMHVRSLSPKHSYVLKLLRKLYENLGEWRKLEELLPELRRRRVIEDKELQLLEERVRRERLKQESCGVDSLVHYWQTIPKDLRQDQSLLIEYCRLMLPLGAGPRVEPLIVTAINRQWNNELVLLYGQIELNEPSHQLAVAEGWLKQHPEDAMLLLSLARLALKNKLWGKARSYLDASIAIAPSPESYQQLGLLLERLGEQDKAAECFRTGLGLASPEPEKALPPIAQRPALGQADTTITPPSLIAISESGRSE